MGVTNATIYKSPIFYEKLITEMDALIEFCPDKAEVIDSNAPGGSTITSLGALYYQIPSGPLGFRDKEKPVQINDNGPDSNYFYGDILADRKEYAKAVGVLEHVLAKPELDQRPVVVQGRRNEKMALLELAVVNLDTISIIARNVVTWLSKCLCSESLGSSRLPCYARNYRIGYPIN